MKMENSAVCSKSYIEAGIVYIIDLFNEDDHLEVLIHYLTWTLKNFFVKIQWALQHWVFKRIGNCNI